MFSCFAYNLLALTSEYVAVSIPTIEEVDRKHE